MKMEMSMLLIQNNRTLYKIYNSNSSTKALKPLFICTIFPTLAKLEPNITIHLVKSIIFYQPKHNENIMNKIWPPIFFCQPTFLGNWADHRQNKIRFILPVQMNYAFSAPPELPSSIQRSKFLHHHHPHILLLTHTYNQWKDIKK